jgi:hypothetical protein
MTSTHVRSARALRNEIRRASRDRRRAASALRRVESYGDAVISAVLSARFRLAASRCEALARLASPASVAAAQRPTKPM